MTNYPELTRLMAARADLEARADALAPQVERDALLQSILATDALKSLAAPPPLFRSMKAPALVGLTLLVAAVAIAVGAPTTDAPTANSFTAGRPSRPTVLEHVELAMASAESMVVYVSTDFGNGVIWETWLDQESGTWNSTSRTRDGALLYEHRIRPGDESADVTVVSHADRAWWSYQAPELRGEAKLHLTPEEIRAQIVDGTLVESGREFVDGLEAIRLHGEEKEKAPGVYVAGGDLLIHPDTYLPIRHEAIGRDGRAITSTYRWLPRTTENIRRTDLAIPPDYTHVATPPVPPGE